VEQKTVKKTQKGGVKKMENVKVSENVNVGNAVLEKAVERKAENGQNGQKATQTQEKNMKTLAKLVMQKLESLDIDLNEISELNEIAKSVKEIELEIQKLSEKRLQLINRGKEIYEKLNGEAKSILQILGILNAEEIEKAIFGKVQVARNPTVRAERGNGVTDKRIVFQGKTYNIASYFLKKMGISGGMKGLEEWARSRGYSLKVEDDVIFIV
jgi:hypothetical protein